MFSEIASQRYIKIKFLECAPNVTWYCIPTFVTLHLVGSYCLLYDISWSNVSLTRILIRGWRHTVELSVRFVEISYIIHFDTISEIGYLLMLERENFSKFLAHKLRHFNFFFKNRALGYQNFFFFFQRRNNTWRMLLSNTYTRLTLLTVLKRMSFFQRSVVSKILAKYF